MNIEKIIKDFENGKVIFVCEDLVSMRSCRKFVRIKLPYITDELQETEMAQILENKTIGFQNENNKLIYVHGMSLYYKNDGAQLFVLTKELYKLLMDDKIEIREKPQGGTMDIIKNAYVWQPNIAADCNCYIGNSELATTASTSGITLTNSIGSAYDTMERLQDEQKATSARIHDMLERISNLEEENTMSDNLHYRVSSMLDEYRSMRQRKLNDYYKKLVKDIKDADKTNDIVKQLSDKANQIIDKMLKAKDIDEEEAKAYKSFYTSEIDSITWKADNQDILTKQSVEQIKEIETKHREEEHELMEKIKEVKVRISFVETYEQAIDVLETYDIIDRFGAFILD